METADFLRHIWPLEGPYCVGHTYLPPDAAKPTLVHTAYTDIDKAAAFAIKKSREENVYFAVHTLKEAKLWRADKKNFKTGEMGKFVVDRTKPNMKEARALCFDLDVGESTATVPKFDTIENAAASLKNFVKQAALPPPTIVLSGGGLHVYWTLTRSIPVPEWQEMAHKLHHLAIHYGMKVDPSKVVDQTMILRPTGTWNIKPGRTPTKTKLVHLGAHTFVQEMDQCIDAAIEAAGVTVPEKVEEKKSVDLGLKPMPQHIYEFLATHANVVDEFDPVPLKDVVDNCAIMEHFVSQAGDVSEPEWYHGLGVVRCVENGSEEVHNVSKGYEGYDYDEVEAKVWQHSQATTGATTCAKLGEVFGSDMCADCPLFNQGRTPIYAAVHEVAPAATVAVVVIDDKPEELDIPDVPDGFTRTKAGVKAKTKDEDGNSGFDLLVPHDLYPLKITRNAASDNRVMWWRADLHDGPVDFELTADDMSASPKLSIKLTNSGVFIIDKHLPKVRTYMSAYINELRKLTSEEVIHENFGWDKDEKMFTIGDKSFTTDGRVKKARLSKSLQNEFGEAFVKRGTLERAVELLKFYNRDEYLAHQFFIGTALGSILMSCTASGNAFVVARGETGASKSTALFTGSTFWGDWRKYHTSGVDRQSTEFGRAQRYRLLRNLPADIDEYTAKEHEALLREALATSQVAGRTSGKSDGTLRADTSLPRAHLLRATSNTEMYGSLAKANSEATAGAMRIMQITMPKRAIHKKAEAEAFLAEIEKNCGHIGEEFARYYAANRAAVEARVIRKAEELDRLGNIEQSERFWGHTAATTIVAVEIAYELGLLPFNAAKIQDWFLNDQLPTMRLAFGTSQITLHDALASYIDYIHGKVMIYDKNASGSIYEAETPKGEIAARTNQWENTMAILRGPFMDYCKRSGLSYTDIKNTLSKPITVGGTTYRPIIVNANTQTHVEKGGPRRNVIKVDLSHPLLDQSPQGAAGTPVNQSGNVIQLPANTGKP